MYGMLNRGFEDYVISRFGENTWVQILETADIGIIEFNDCEIYDDSLTYKIVTVSSQITGTSCDSLLHSFGRHWILYTGRESWGAVFESGGANFIDFVKGLDAMHSRVQLTMPKTKMPSFSVHPLETEGQYIVKYHSEREGFASMVTGLLSGLADIFDECWDIDQTGWRCKDGFDSFSLRKVAVECWDRRSIGES